MKEKKNNSYETDLSSTSSTESGHSLKNNEYLEMVDANTIRLPLLLEARKYEYQKQIEVASKKNESTSSSSFCRSSQESPFAGFRETPPKMLQEQRFVYEDTTEIELESTENDGADHDDVVYVQTFPLFTAEAAKNATMTPLSNCEATKNATLPLITYEAAKNTTLPLITCEAAKNTTLPLITCEAYKSVTTYDILVNSEHSCNAVDIPLVRCEYQQSTEKMQVTELHVEISDLSFNGKIKALDLNCSTDEIVQPQNNESVCERKILDFNTSSFFFKCGLSPDLFADDDDDDDDGANVENLPVEHEVKFEVPIKSVAQSIKEDVPSKDEQMDTSANRSMNCPTESSFADETTLDSFTHNEKNSYQLFRENCKRERELLRRTRKCLSGVPPPPSLTIPQIDLIQLVHERKSDIFNFFNKISDVADDEKLNKPNQRTSLFKPTHSLDEAKVMPWRDVLGVRQHGFSYNLTTASEQCEYLGLSVIERFVGAETTSSYRRSPSSAKKRNLREKLLPQSPGNRLSHLAKRRAIFSSANLATTSQRSASALGPQIVIDKRKLRNRRKAATPKRKTPGSKKKTRKTPSSSARKLQYRLDLNKAAPSRETSKRALFQSPINIQKQQNLIKPHIKPEIATKVENTKRALFSPDTTDQQQTEMPTTSAASQRSEPLLLKRKRNQNDDNDEDDDVAELYMPSKKLSRCDTSSLTPRTLKVKSQSFCIGAGSSEVATLKTTTLAENLKTAKRNLLANGNSYNSFQSLSSTGSISSFHRGSNGGSASSLSNEQKIQRTSSDTAAASVSLTENQKKKLLWAVSQALQEKKITTKHENFKQYASVLARVVRRIFQEFYQRTSTSNSETLLRLSKRYVFYVVSGRSCDDIYTQVRAEETKRLSTNRLTGYIGPEEYAQRKQQQLFSKQPSQSSLMPNSFSLCGSMQNLMSIDDTCSRQSIAPSSQMTIETITNQSNFSNCLATKCSKQQNSSSKSNLGSLALRENSAQKNFTGKDQRNVSPYAKSNSGLKPTNNVSVTDSMHASASAKAKRQIFFDS